MNDSGMVAFCLSNSITSTAKALALTFGAGDPDVVAVLGATIPTTTRKWWAIDSAPSLNNAGQVAFKAQISIDGIVGASYGVFFHDASGGLHEVTRRGRPFLGSIIENVDFAGTSNNEWREMKMIKSPLAVPGHDCNLAGESCRRILVMPPQKWQE